MSLLLLTSFNCNRLLIAHEAGSLLVIRRTTTMLFQLLLSFPKSLIAGVKPYEEKFDGSDFLLL